MKRNGLVLFTWMFSVKAVVIGRGSIVGAAAVVTWAIPARGILRLAILRESLSGKEK